MKQCSQCHGVKQQMCKDSGTLLNAPCDHCDSTGIEPQVYYVNIMTHKNFDRNISEMIWAHSTLFITRKEAEEFTHREFIVVKTIEIKV